jgi:hypothetical protein
LSAARRRRSTRASRAPVIRAALARRERLAGRGMSVT